MSEIPNVLLYSNALSKLQQETVIFWRVRTAIAEAIRSKDYEEVFWSLTELETMWLYGAPAMRRSYAKVLDELRPGWQVAFLAEQA